MKKGIFFGFTIIFGVITLFITAGIYAGNTVPDVIPMENKAYEHGRGIVQFTHKKHYANYQIGCGECHHDENGKPLNMLKEGDSVQGCFECHNKPGEMKGKNAAGMSRNEKLAYHANAMHENCRGCHKKFNQENNTQAAPTTCTKCHPKK